MRLIRPLGQHGDTIVEVLIAIAVAGGILGTSYAIVGRNSKSYQQVNEHTEALKLAEAQLESIRQIATGTDTAKQNAVFTSPFTGSFCINGATVNTAPPCASGPSGRYKIEVKRSDSNKFESIVTWDGVNSGQDRVSLNYRVSK